MEGRFELHSTRARHRNCGFPWADARRYRCEWKVFLEEPYFGHFVSSPTPQMKSVTGRLLVLWWRKRLTAIVKSSARAGGASNRPFAHHWISPWSRFLRLPRCRLDVAR